MSSNQRTILIVSVAALVLLLICGFCLMIAAGIYLFSAPASSGQDAGGPVWIPESQPTPQVVRPAETQASPGPAPTLPAYTINPDAAAETLLTLSQAQIPINDRADLALRLEGKRDIPATLEPPAAPFEVGARKSFWLSNSDNNENFQVQAVLRYATPHAYFWIQDGVDFNQRELRDLAETFEERIYPTNREFFGTEWTPGVDGDVHLYILYASGIGSGVAGYFSSNDSYHPQLEEFSNGHEMFVFNADTVALDESFTYGVLAHEFQHMIHWYRDRNEDLWLNEGMADLAMFLNGYDIGGHDYLYVSDPDLQLNDWPNDQNLTTPHYGASFLFTNYFLSRFGDAATQALVNQDANGLESIDLVLAQLGIQDPLTGQAITADDVFADWVITSYLQDPQVGDGRFIYTDYPDAPAPEATEELRSCDSRVNTRQVSQYGVDYIRLRCRGDVTLHFEGSVQVGVLATNARSGDYAFWSNKGEESDMTLTRSFDFSQHSGPLTLTYWTWYDLETDFDYAYLLASTDGQTWEMLQPPSGTASDPTGANYGWGYNSVSGASSSGAPAWIEERVDLSRFAGQQVQLRFEYITDAAVNGEGLLVDDVAIPEIGYFSDFEQDDGGWESAGFVRIQNLLPQTYRLSLILKDGSTQVEYVPLSSDNSAQVKLDFSGDLDEAILIISGTTRYTRQPAPYRFYFK